MNKQELIKKIKEMPVFATTISKISLVRKCEVLKLIAQLNQVERLDVPQKVTIPQFVADWIEECKNDDFHLFGAMEEMSLHQKKLDYWFREDDNMELFALAWIDGYTVEVQKEKRYYVRFKGMESDDFNYLNFIKFQHAWVLSSIKLDKKFRTEHTKKQLEEAGFDWVFDCPGVEVEEVEG